MISLEVKVPISKSDIEKVEKATDHTDPNLREDYYYLCTGMCSASIEELYSIPGKSNPRIKLCITDFVPTNDKVGFLTNTSTEKSGIAHSEAKLVVNNLVDSEKGAVNEEYSTLVENPEAIRKMLALQGFNVEKRLTRTINVNVACGNKTTRNMEVNLTAYGDDDRNMFCEIRYDGDSNDIMQASENVVNIFDILGLDMSKKDNRSLEDILGDNY